ncbi:hypothetical protein D9M69_612260 [compost metagenome]
MTAWRCSVTGWFLMMPPISTWLWGSLSVPPAIMRHGISLAGSPALTTSTETVIFLSLTGVMTARPSSRIMNVSPSSRRYRWAGGSRVSLSGKSRPKPYPISKSAGLTDHWATGASVPMPSSRPLIFHSRAAFLTASAPSVPAGPAFCLTASPGKPPPPVTWALTWPCLPTG